MITVIILYPKDFQSYSKFCRKVSNIFKNLAGGVVVYPADPNGFIEQFFLESKPGFTLVENSDWGAMALTHGIVFDDGEEFSAELKLLQDLDIPIRTVIVQITRVVNIKRDVIYQGIKSSKNYEYIGRGSYWGNPYSMYEEGNDREEVIRKFKYDFDYDKFVNKDKGEVYRLAGKRLGCFCKPDKCHGDILADFLNSWDDGK